jgi:hypothetical protein
VEVDAPAKVDGCVEMSTGVLDDLSVGWDHEASVGPVPVAVLCR